MSDRDKKNDLRSLYANNLVARKVFDVWAQKKRTSPETLLAQTSAEAGIEDDEDVKIFFRTLQEYGFGRYIKASRGGQARFEWGWVDEDDPDSRYALAAVARIAKGSNEAWDGVGTGGDEEDETNFFNRSSGASGSSVSIKLAVNDISVHLELPKYFDPDEDLEDLLELIKASVRSKFKRRRA
jgi:hypothetical protein